MAGDGVKTNRAAKIKARLREPSTWASVAAVVAFAAGHPEIAAAVTPPDAATWQSLVAVLAPAVLGVILPERGA